MSKDLHALNIVRMIFGTRSIRDSDDIFYEDGISRRRSHVLAFEHTFIKW